MGSVAQNNITIHLRLRSLANRRASTKATVVNTPEILMRGLSQMKNWVIGGAVLEDEANGTS